jgi:hypothetical protein
MKKNIHLIPTDKPSRLYSFYGILEDLTYNKTFTIVNEKVAKINLHKDLKDYQEKLIRGGWKSENIYITSDEEIKEKDWKYNKLAVGSISKTTKENIDGIKRDKEKGYTNHLYKIILTTDIELIEDGIQAIYDDFLEWFVKNPTCEEIKVIHKFDEEWSEESGAYEIDYYKIVIPKEEPNQESIQEFIEKHGITEQQLIEGYTQGLELIFENAFKESKQESIESAIVDYISEKSERAREYGLVYSAIKFGMGLQQERSYSEDDLKEAFKQSRQAKIFEKDMPPVYESFEDWFEQFKKK